MTPTDLLGLAAAFTATIAMAPQVIKICKTKNTRDLSLGTFILVPSTLFLWFIYGLLIGSYPIIIGNAVGFALNIYIVVMKIKYG
jgi:MtN3 and saliva related transmembrane protein